MKSIMALVLCQVRLMATFLKSTTAPIQQEGEAPVRLSEEEEHASNRVKLELVEVLLNNLLRRIPPDLFR